MTNQSEFPYAGEVFPAAEKKYKEIIFFVHFFGGSKKLLRRHIEFVNRLGFDAFAFNLSNDWGLHKWPFTRKGRFGLKHAFAEEIETLLNLLPQNKIVFAFSNLSAAAIEALDDRRCHDIRGLICDSGPAANFIQSSYNLFTYQLKTTFIPWRLIKSVLLGPYWSPYFHLDIRKQLARFPKSFPVLSIHAGKDLLISPETIEAIFENLKNLDWQKLDLPLAEHIRGLKDFPEEYEPKVKAFLQQNAQS